MPVATKPKRKIKARVGTAPVKTPKALLFLRTCDKDGRSHGGFQWPLTVGATVAAPDWNDRAECGGGHRSTITGGDKATIQIVRWDGDRNRTHVGYIGEDGLTPNTPYKLDANGKFVNVA